MHFTLPTVKATGKVAEIAVTTRESSRYPATVNVRFRLPKATLRVEHDGGAVEGPGAVVAQFPAVMN